MKTTTLVFSGPSTAALVEREISGLADGQILVENRVSLVSPGTELALYTGRHIGFDDPDIAWCRFPLDIGYASVGIVLESRNPAYPEGTRVLHYGAHSTYSVLDDQTTTIRVPDSLGDEGACFGRFAQIAYSSIAACPRSFGRVLVYGAGIIGNLAAQWFRVSGAESVGIRDLSEARRRMAADCGIEAVNDEADASPPDTVIEATGVPGVVEAALDEAAVAGQVVLLGSTRGTVEINVYKKIHRKALILSGAHETVLGDQAFGVLKKSLDMLNEGSLVVSPLVTHRISSGELPGIYEHLLAEPDRYLGVLVSWGGGE